MTTFSQSDEPYRRAIEAPGRELAAAFVSAKAVPTIDLSGVDLTNALLMRLKSYFSAQDTIKASLDKVYAPPAADFFVESTLFFLKVVLGRLAPGTEVVSEKNIVRKKGSMRPDISVWRGDSVVAAVECKTQLGWNRDGWLQDFEKREVRLQREHPNAGLFLWVMTDRNWAGFGSDRRVGKQFFVLLGGIWPRAFELESSGAITNRLEELISALMATLGANASLNR